MDDDSQTGREGKEEKIDWTPESQQTNMSREHVTQHHNATISCTAA